MALRQLASAFQKIGNHHPPTPRPRHTHGQCDQVFSVHSRYLAKHRALTINDLGNELRKSYSNDDANGCRKRPEIFYLGESADVKSWLEPVAASVNNITGSHQYLIELQEVDGVNKAVLRCKQFAASSDDRWETVGSLLKVRAAGRFTLSGECQQALFQHVQLDRHIPPPEPPPSPLQAKKKKKTHPLPPLSQGLPEGSPKQAPLRSLFFKHPQRVARGELTEEQYASVQDHEERRSQRHQDARCVEWCRRSV